MIPISIELNEGVVDLIKRIADEIIPKAWKNIEAKFSISEVDLHFLCESKDLSNLRVWIFDGEGGEVAYFEGSNTPTTSVRIGSNRRNYDITEIALLFQLSRCAREFFRTDQLPFKQQFERHRLSFIRFHEQTTLKQKIASSHVAIVDSDTPLDERLRLGRGFAQFDEQSLGVDAQSIFLDDFGVNIPEAEAIKLESHPYFVLDHGQYYSVRLHNQGRNDADANLFIDGELMGRFRVTSKSSIEIEHPFDDRGRFTFYLLDSDEGREIGLKTSPGLGLIQVAFLPEHDLAVKVRGIAWEHREAGSMTERVKFALEALKVRRRSDGKFGPDEEIIEAIKNELLDRFGAVKDADDSGILFASRRARPGGWNDPTGTSELPLAGGTGLSGKSDQEFTTVEEIIEDFEKETVISLRLGGRHPDPNCPRPLRDRRANSVPPPLT